MTRKNITFTDIIINERETILKEWIGLSWEQCFSQSEPALNRNCSSIPGCNTDIPLKHIFRTGLEGIFDQLIEGRLPDIRHPLLNEVIEILAIQDSPPSKALSFYESLTVIIKNRFKEYLTAENIYAKDVDDNIKRQFNIFIENINKALYVSFDIYMNTRERLFNIKLKEITASNYRLLKMAKLITIDACE